MHIVPFDNNNLPIVDVANPTVPLNYFNILKLTKGQSFDYQVPGYETCIVPATGSLDIDVEGHDFEVLKSIDLNIHKVNVILIEVGSNELEIDLYLRKHDYKSYILVQRNKFYIKN